MTVACIAHARTGGTDAGRWVSSRWAAARAYLWSSDSVVRGLSGDRVTDAATLVVAHWANETAWGRFEWSYNLGGQVCRSAEPYCTCNLERPPRSAISLAAYRSLEDGVRDYFRRVESIAPQALVELHDGSPAWYRSMVGPWIERTDEDHQVADHANVVLSVVDRLRARGETVPFAVEARARSAWNEYARVNPGATHQDSQPVGARRRASRSGGLALLALGALGYLFSK